MMGERRVMQEALFCGFSLERHVPDNHMLRGIDRFVDVGTEGALEPLLHRGRTALDRSRADDAHADRLLLPRHSFRAAAVGRGLLNRAYRWFCGLGVRRQRSGSFDVFQEPPRPFPRERSPAREMVAAERPGEHVGKVENAHAAKWQGHRRSRSRRRAIHQIGGRAEPESATVGTGLRRIGNSLEMSSVDCYFARSGRLYSVE